MNDELRREFADPPVDFRPLQIIHGFDGMGTDADAIGRGLEALLAAGCGGVVANVGWPGYVRDEGRWRVFLFGAEEARRRRMPLWIYDEEGYPSGAAGDIVLEGHPELEAQGLVCASLPVEPGATARIEPPPGAEPWVCAVALLPDAPGGRGVAQRLPVAVPSAGPVEWQAPAAPHQWLLYCFAPRVMFQDTHAALNVFARRRSVNLLDARVGRRFVQVTHEEYSRRVSPEALADVRATFTDEPSLMVAYLTPARWSRPAALPWCDDLPQEFARRAGYALETFLPDLFFDIGEAERVRCDFHRVVAELIAERYFGPIQEWCHAHGIASSGHLLCEERLSHHVWFEGNAFTCLRRMDWPGIDMLWSVPEEILAGDLLLTPKFISSAAHICARPIVMSETSDYAERTQGRPASLEQMAGTAGLQYALGVNLITSYYPWSSYGPADATWAGTDPAPNAYRAYCDYVGRLGVMLRGGRHLCQIAVYYPVATMQACFRPTALGLWENDALGPRVAALDALVRDLGRGLLQRQMDFDFVDGEALAAAKIEGGSLFIGNESYRALVLPGASVMEREALAAVVRFARAGGAVIAVERLPEHFARRLDGNATELAAELREAGVEALSLSDALEQAAKKAPAEVMIEPASPHLLALHRLRDDGRHVYFITNASGAECRFSVRLPAQGDASVCWPRTGVVSAHNLDQRGGVPLKLGPYEGVFVLVPEKRGSRR